MTPEQRKLARHALGLDLSAQSYRNRYIASPGSPAYDDWSALVAAGNAIRCDDPRYSGGIVFHMTPQGARKALRDGESLDPEDFPPETKETT